MVDADLGPAQLVRGGRNERPVVDEGAPGFREGEQRGCLAAAGPADPGPDPARVLDREEMRLGQAPAPCGAWPPP